MAPGLADAAHFYGEINQTLRADSQGAGGICRNSDHDFRSLQGVSYKCFCRTGRGNSRTGSGIQGYTAGPCGQRTALNQQYGEAGRLDNDPRKEHRRYGY